MGKTKKDKTKKQAPQQRPSDGNMSAEKFSYLKNKKIILPIIIAITFLAFFPSLQNDFVFWDDPEYVLNNPYIKELNINKLMDFEIGRAHV